MADKKKGTRLFYLVSCQKACVIKRKPGAASRPTHLACKYDLSPWSRRLSAKTGSLSNRPHQFRLPVTERRTRWAWHAHPPLAAQHLDSSLCLLNIQSIPCSCLHIRHVCKLEKRKTKAEVWNRVYLYGTVELIGIELGRSFQSGHDHLPKVSRQLGMQVFN